MSLLKEIPGASLFGALFSPVPQLAVGRKLAVVGNSPFWANKWKAYVHSFTFDKMIDVRQKLWSCK